jgi:alpha 1,6-mannosyltransferase
MQVDLSGSGPFTDAVLRYLLVRYGVTPSKLRGLNGPVRIGDVL